MREIVVRAVLGLLILPSIGVLWAAYASNSQDSWSAIAAALAVIVAVVSAWTSHDVVTMERARQAPYPYPSLDGHRRYMLLQLRVTNLGGGTAHNVRLVWDRPLTRTNGQPVRFTEQADSPDVPVLLPGQTISAYVDGMHDFLRANATATYRGRVEFEDGNGRTKRHPFVVSAEPFRTGLTFETETPRTEHELRKFRPS